MLTARPVFDRRPFNRSPVLRGSATFVCGIERVVDTEGEGEGHVWIEIGTRTDPKGRVGRGEMDGDTRERSIQRRLVHRWSDISVLVSLLICMSSSFSSCRAPPTPVLVPFAPPLATLLAPRSPHRYPPPPSSSLPLAHSAVKRRCFLSDQINPTTTGPRNAVLQPTPRAPRPVRPYKLRYYSPIRDD